MASLALLQPWAAHAHGPGHYLGCVSLPGQIPGHRPIQPGEITASLPVGEALGLLAIEGSQRARVR